MTTMLMRNKVNNAIARVPEIHKPRSIFGIQFSRKQTMKAAYIVPIFYEEVLPGDTWELSMTALIRLLPQVAPPIDNLTASTFFFYDPYRLEWENFPKQHGERKNPNDHIDYITPKMICPTGGFTHKSLQDYLGKPVGVEVDTTSLGERMYNRIYNQYFRSEMLQDSIFENDTDTDDSIENYVLRKVSKMHDGYFTDALPSLQLGEPVKLPLGTTAPVKNVQYDGTVTDLSQIGAQRVQFWTQKQTESQVHYTKGTGFENLIGANKDGLGTNHYQSTDTGPMTNNGGTNMSRLYMAQYADLSEAVSADISALRLMIRMQEILEHDQRNGVRYTEILEGRYGVTNPDLRLGRVQYLGGTKTPIFTTPVVQTSGTGAGSNTPQGNLSGYSVTTDNGNVVRASFGEFGAIMGLMVISATPQYQYGLDRKFTRWERFDYMYPEFQGISDQAILNKELFAQDDTIMGADGTTPVNDEVWGYAPRYEEYRTFKNQICGELKSNYENSLDVWTYAEAMEELQNLNENFITDKSDEILQRSMAVQTSQEGEIEDQFLVDIAFSGAVSRVLVSKPVPHTGGIM